MLQHIASIVSAIAWPSALIYVALLFRREIRALFAGLSQSSKNIRLKYGSFELETKFVEKIEQHLKKIAEEPNADKRQELASLKAALDLSLESIDPEARRTLYWLNENQLTNCSHINWHYQRDELKYESVKQLSQNGLVQLFPMYDGDELIKIHPIVKDFLVGKKNEEKA